MLGCCFITFVTRNHGESFPLPWSYQWRRCRRLSLRNSIKDRWNPPRNAHDGDFWRDRSVKGECLPFLRGRPRRLDPAFFHIAAALFTAWTNRVVAWATKDAIHDYPLEQKRNNTVYRAGHLREKRRGVHILIHATECQIGGERGKALNPVSFVPASRVNNAGRVAQYGAIETHVIYRKYSFRLIIGARWY